MANTDQQVVKIMAQEIIRAIKKVNEDNNKKYIDNQLKNIKVTGSTGVVGGGSGGISGTIDVSQVDGLYSAIAGFIGDAPTNAELGDYEAGRIVSVMSGLAAIEVQNAVIDTAQIENLYASYGEFINLLADNAEIGNLDVGKIKADIATLGMANIDSATIKYSQITDLDTDTAIIRTGIGGKLYIDKLAVTEAQVLSIFTGELVLQGADGKLHTIYVDEEGNVNTKERPVRGYDIDQGTIKGDNIAENTITGALITENAITARELNVSQIFADEALIRAIKASNIDVSDLFANNGFINSLTTSIIQSPTIGAEIDISKNSSIEMTNSRISMIVTGESSESQLVLTDGMINAISEQVNIMADEIDLSANKTITLAIKNELQSGEYSFEQIIISNNEPDTEYLNVDQIWLDTSKSPNVFKKWTGTEWEIINDTSDLVEKLESAQLNIDSTNASIEALTNRVTTSENRIEQVAGLQLTPEQIVATVIESTDYQDDKKEVVETAVASAKLTADGFETLVVENIADPNSSLSKLSQTAEKIDWIVAGKNGESEIELTEEAIKAISDHVDVSAESINAIADQIDLSGNTSIKISSEQLDFIGKNISLIGNESISFVVLPEIERNASKVFRQETQPTLADRAKTGDLWIKPSTGAIYQADAIGFMIDEDGIMYLDHATGDGYVARIAVDDIHSMEANFAMTVDENGVIVATPVAWNLVRDKTVTSLIDNLSDTVDGKTTVFYQTEDPTTTGANVENGDLWYDTDANPVIIYRYNKSTLSWENITDNALAKALKAAQDVADGQVVCYTQDTDPLNDSDKEIKHGDMWINTASGNRLFVYDENTSAWIECLNGIISTMQSDIDNANRVANGAVEEIEYRKQYVVIDENGVNIKDENMASALKITSAAVTINTGAENAKGYSQFTASYVQFGDYQLRKTTDNGLVFRMA